MSDKKIKNKEGISSGRDVTIGNVSGQVAIGSHISQTQTLSNEDKQDLLKSLLGFQEEITKLCLPSNEATTILGDIAAAAKEGKKEVPDIEKIQGRFQGALDTIKEVGDTIETVSNWEWTKKILKILGKIGLSVML